MTDLDYLQQAYRVAGQSPDPSTQNGAILVNKFTGKILCTAYNDFAKNVQQTNERWKQPLKYQYVEHAERNVIYQCAKLGINTDDSIMYCPWFACVDCARAIIQAGISEVVGHDIDIHKSRSDWQQSIKLALSMLHESGIKYRYVTGKMGGVSIRFNGQNIQP